MHHLHHTNSTQVHRHRNTKQKGGHHIPGSSLDLKGAYSHKLFIAKAMALHIIIYITLVLKENRYISVFSNLSSYLLIANLDYHHDIEIKIIDQSLCGHFSFAY